MDDHAHAPDRAAEALRRAIAEGHLLPGAKLAEVQLTKRLEVSRHTLRSAFQVLAGEGLVERHPNRGVFVHSPTAEDIREIYRVRRIIEIGAVRAAPFSQSALTQLRQIVTDADDASRADDVFTMAQANQRFHRTLIAQAGSAMLDTLMDQVLARMRLLFATMGEEPDFHHVYFRRNSELLELLSDGRLHEAEEYLLDYLDHAENTLLQVLTGDPASPRP